MPVIKRIPVDEIKGGSVILRFDKDGVPYSFYAQSLPPSMVKSVKKTIAENGAKYAFIREAVKPDGGGQKENAQEARVQTLLDNISAPAKISCSKVAIEEVIAAQKVHGKARQITKNVLSEVRLGKAVDTETSKVVVTDLLESCLKNPEIFVNMSRLKDFDDYTFTHSVNVAVLAISIGRRLGMDYKELTNLGLAALLHDVGKMRVPESILNKPGKLTEEEFFVMKMHPVYSYELLRSDSSIPAEVIKAVRQHHEKSDGTGYPDGLKEKEISKYAKIIAISDVYDAITSERVYHKSLMATDALKMLFTWSGKHFNEVLVKFFINLIGIYPVGTTVILDSGELAVVFTSDKDGGIQPQVLIITDEQRNALKEPLLFDLASRNSTTGRPYKRILSPINKNEISVDGNDVISKYIKSSPPPLIIEERMFS